jgi:hypothetical protein
MDSFAHRDVLKYIARTPYVHSLLTQCARELRNHLGPHIVYTRRESSQSGAVICQRNGIFAAAPIICVRLFDKMWRVSSVNGYFLLITPASAWSNGGTEHTDTFISGRYFTGSGAQLDSLFADIFGPKFVRCARKRFDVSSLVQVFPGLPCKVEYVSSDVRLVHMRKIGYAVTIDEKSITVSVISKTRPRILSTCPFVGMSSPARSGFFAVNGREYWIERKMRKIIAAAFALYQIVPVEKV